jgi:ABC-type amino acid transport substrate-binding protein
MKEKIMRVGVAILVVSASVLLQGTDIAQACGDKFLLVGRSTKFHQAYAAIYPASIIVFAQSQRSAAKAIRDPRLQSDLKKAGHRVSIAEDETALARALESDRIDLVLTDAADADRIARQASNAPAKPRVLPVMYQPTPEEAKDVEQRYQCRLTSSDRTDKFLAAIDDAMKARADSKKKGKS